ncbi:MAG: hypothetical protein ACPKQO_07225 [Nitrososphaeraceae archaeon]
MTISYEKPISKFLTGDIVSKYLETSTMEIGILKIEDNISATLTSVGGCCK